MIRVVMKTLFGGVLAAVLLASTHAYANTSDDVVANVTKLLDEAFRLDRAMYDKCNDFAEDAYDVCTNNSSHDCLKIRSRAERTCDEQHTDRMIRIGINPAPPTQPTVGKPLEGVTNHVRITIEGSQALVPLTVGSLALTAPIDTGASSMSVPSQPPTG
jgi:hypothetical protein